MNNSVLINTIFYLMMNNKTNLPEENSYNYYYLNIGKEMNSTKCYGIYGCFDLSPPWTSEHRPVSLFPEGLKKIEPKYPYYSRRSYPNYTLVDLDVFDVIKSSGIDASLPLYVISHGYIESDMTWILEITEELLKVEDCSVIVVDWHGGSGPPYTQAVANIRLLGVVTAHLIADFAKHTPNRDLDRVHCIGHSLGSHLCGYAGYTLQKQFNLTLGRITGLDPAEPHFAKSQPPVRLDRTAAHYVDVIHTDASAFIRGGLGMTERIGHVDYYPNGGTNMPGCGKSVVQYISEENGSFFQGIKDYLGCNHMRSYEYFRESINPTCPFMTISCTSYEDFRKGNCFECGRNNQHCVAFGFRGRENYKKLLNDGLIRPHHNLIQYLMTGDRYPFCKVHYRITVKISNSSQSLLHGGEIGQLWFTMHGMTDGKGFKSDKIAFNDGGYHAPGELYKAVVPGNAVNVIRGVEIEWKYHSSVFNPLTWRLLTSPRVHVEKVSVHTLETKQKIEVCFKNDEPLISGISRLLLPSYCK